MGRSDLFRSTSRPRRFTWCYQAVRALLMVAIAYCVPCLHYLRWRLRCFSRTACAKNTALRPHCGTNETGDGLILRQRREMDAFDACDGHQHSSASLPLLVTTRQGSPLTAMAIWHWRQHVRIPRRDAQSFSDLPTARAGKADAREVQAKRRSKWYAGT